MMRVPVPEDIQKAAKRIARNIKQRLPPNIAFVVLVAPFGSNPNDDWTFYISNAEHGSMIKLLSEFLSVEGN